MKIALKTGLIAGLLIAVVLVLGGCLTTTQPTSTAAAEQPSFWSQWGIFIFLILIFVVFYFIMIRPQRKRQKEHQEMMQNLQKGDRVITAGGIYGTIDSLSEDSVIIRVEGGGMLRVARGSIALRPEPQQYTGKK